MTEQTAPATTTRTAVLVPSWLVLIYYLAMIMLAIVFTLWAIGAIGSGN